LVAAALGDRAIACPAAGGPVCVAVADVIRAIGDGLIGDCTSPGD